jgi:hypothetical protein
MKKQKKNNLRKDTVISDGFHVGIELETMIPCDSDHAEHDTDACIDSYRQSLDDEGAVGILTNYFGLDRSDARRLESYFNVDQWIDDACNDYDCGGDCGLTIPGTGGDSARRELESDLKNMTGNTSFKVVTDTSIDMDSGETDAEVCWNYYASKETIRDNEKILEHLKDIDARFNTSCGLHINLNNYLGLQCDANVSTRELDFLFNFVAKSRRDSSFCNRLGIGVDGQKYSMIFFQGDRLEFRFFSPTFDAEKLNHYVALANVVYKRLAGEKAGLSKKSMRYFLKKMTEKNGIPLEVAEDTLKRVNSLKSYDELQKIDV